MDSGSQVIELACVPPTMVGEIWPKVRVLIYNAMKRAELSSFASLERRVLDGNAFLWLAFDKTAGIHAAAVTELIETEWGKFLNVSACGGAGMQNWVGLLEKIEDWARGEECKAVRLTGRMGWQQVLKDYRPKRVVLEKVLQDG